MKKLFALTLLLAAVAFPQIVVIQGSDTISSSRSVINSNFAYLNTGKIAIFSGSGAPGSLSTSKFGSLYVDTLNQVTYQCYLSPGPCTAVAANNWVLLGSGGGGGGNVTHTGTLISGLPVIGNAGADVAVGTKTGTGTQFVTSQAPVITSAALIAPSLGVATATSINGVTVAGVGTTVVTGSANTGLAAMTLDMSASTSAAALRVPNIAGAAPTVGGTVAYDTTNKNVHAGSNGVDNLLALVPATVSVVDGDCAVLRLTAGTVTIGDSGGACGTAAGLGDPGSNGVVVRTALNVTTARTLAATSPITVTNGSGVAGAPTFACATCGVTGSPLSQFAATTSAQFAGVISDETGTGLVVLNNTPTLVTPAIASFANAVHDHLSNPGGGVLDAAAIATGIIPAARGGVGTLTGIVQGNGASAPTANAAAAALQYLRRKPNVTGTVYEFTSPIEKNFADYNYSQQPGGSLSAGANTITLTPGPLGLNTALSNMQAYLSAGTGTAETVTITAGTCDGTGQASCTVTFTAANSHSGAWTIQSATGGFTEAQATLASTGGILRAPCGTVNLYGTLPLGNGTATTQSTLNAVVLRGCGSGRGADVSSLSAGATRLFWQGAAAGTVVKVFGPIGNAEISDLQIDGNSTANIGLDIAHSYASYYARLSLVNLATIGVRSQAVDFAFSGMVTGNNNNEFDSVIVSASTGSASFRGLQLGQGVVNVNTIFDSASNAFINCNFVGGAGIGIELRYADNNSFYQSNSSGSVQGILFTAVGTLPGANVFFQSPSGGTVAANPATFAPPSPNMFLPLGNTDSGQNPASLVSFASGFDSNGWWFGRMKNAPLYYAGVTASTAIASTTAETAFDRSYTIPARALNYKGATVRVRASGKVSSTGTPTLIIKVYVGGTGGSAFGIYSFTVGSGVTNDSWSVDSDFLINTAGVGALMVGPGIGIMGGVSGAAIVRANVSQGTAALDTTIAQDIVVTATWGTNSASNTATMNDLQVDVVYPSVVQ